MAITKVSAALVDLDGGVVINESSADADFRVESNGNTHMLFVDGGNDCVSIGASTDLTGALNITHGNDFGLVTSGGFNFQAKFESTDAEAGIVIEDSNSGTDYNRIGVITNDMAFTTNNSESVRINSSGLVGIGTSAPHEMLHVEGVSGTEVLVAARTDDAGALASYYFKTDSTGTDVRKKAAFIFKRDDPGTRGTGALHICVDGANDEGSAAIVDSKMAFFASGESAITGGTFYVSGEGNAFAAGSHNGMQFAINGQSVSSRAATNAQTHKSFFNPNGSVGTITTNGSATAFNTSSDYRLKENVITDWDGTTLLKQLKPSKFNFKADADTTIQGFLAHEVSSIVPQAVSGEKDAVYTAEEEAEGEGVKGQPNYQGIDHSKLVPLLVKTIQEMDARITTLEG